MSKNKNKYYDPAQEENKEDKIEENIENTMAEEAKEDLAVEEEAVEPEGGDKTAQLTAELEKEKKEYLFLMAEFDNFRKRTLREKSEIIKNAGEKVLKGLLPIADDFERGIAAAKSSDNAEAVLEGMELIYSKLCKFMEQNGVKPIDPEDKDFDTEKHEAISAVPVQDETQKGKILDTVEKGYMINDKVLRHAKVVVGQ